MRAYTRRAPRDIRCVFGNLPNRHTCRCAPCGAWRQAHDRAVTARDSSLAGSRTKDLQHQRDVRAAWRTLAESKDQS